MIFGKRSHKQLAQDCVIIGDPLFCFLQVLFYALTAPTVSVQFLVESRFELHQVVSLFAEMDMNYPILC